MPRPDLYISVDVEADGPIPGPYSMLSFGAAVAGSFDGTTFSPQDPSLQTFYAELAPISDSFVPEALAVSGLDREALKTSGQDPRAAMDAFNAWMEEVAEGRKPVLVAYPSSFDWMFIYHYLQSFASRQILSHSAVFDMKTMYATKARALHSRAVKRSMPKRLLSKRPHTHHGLDDAIEQAELFQNLFTWTPTPAPILTKDA